MIIDYQLVSDVTSYVISSLVFYAPCDLLRQILELCRIRRKLPKTIKSVTMF